MRRFALLTVLAAFVFSCGGQWYVLQAVAWANMIHDYSKMVPFSQAVEMTLSGKYPCALCHLIAERKNSENSKLATIEKQEKFFSSPLIAAVPVQPGLVRYFSSGDNFLRTRSEPPPLPPPRLA